MTLRMRITITIPEAANDADIARAARQVLSQLAAEIVRASARWPNNNSR